MGNVTDFLLHVSPEERAKRNALAQYQKLVQLRGPDAAVQALDPLSRQILGLQDPISSDENVTAATGKMSQNYPQADPALLRALVSSLVGAPQTGPVPQQTGTLLPDTQGLTNAGPGFIDAADLAAVGGGEHVPLDALGLTAKEKTAQAEKKTSDIAGTMANVMYTTGSGPEDAMAIAKYAHGEPLPPGTKLPPNYRTIVDVTRLSSQLKEDAASTQERLARIQNLNYESALNIQKLNRFMLGDPEQIKLLLDTARALPKGADSDQARLSIISGILRKAGVTQEDIQADPTGLAGIASWLVSGWGKLFSGGKGAEAEAMAANTAKVLSALPSANAGGAPAVPTTPSLPVQEMPPELQKFLPAENKPAPTAAAPTTPAATTTNAAVAEPKKTPVDVTPVRRQVTPLAAETFNSALQASIAGRPIQTGSGMKIVDPYTLVQDFKSKYNVPDTFEQSVMEKIKQSTDQLGQSPISKPGVLESLMQALTTAGSAVQQAGAGNLRQALMNALTRSNSGNAGAKNTGTARK